MDGFPTPGDGVPSGLSVGEAVMSSPSGAHTVKPWAVPYAMHHTRPSSRGRIRARLATERKRIIAS
jgi:hypothetical protein